MSILVRVISYSGLLGIERGANTGAEPSGRSRIATTAVRQRKSLRLRAAAGVPRGCQNDVPSYRCFDNRQSLAPWVVVHMCARSPYARPVVLSLGSNLGDRYAIMQALERGVSSLLQAPLMWSSLMETEPVGADTAQPWYLNRLVAGGCDMAPRELLDACLGLERRFGRERPYRWAPRTSDIDILLYADRIVDEPHLTIPHPRIVERRFCLYGLNELLPDFVIPGSGERVARLYETMGEQVREQKMRVVMNS